jgi:hypothetical protein
LASDQLLAALGAGAARAGTKPPHARTKLPAAKPPPPPLSAEDAEVARDLALLEKLEMLKTLDLFEPDPPPPKP